MITSLAAKKLAWLYGASGSARKADAATRYKKPQRSKHLAALLLSWLPLFLGVASLLAIAVVVDPYNVRPWGLKTQLADHRYPDTEWPLLIKAATADEHGVALVGGSSVMGISKDQLERVFGRETRPINLAYPYALPADTKETLQIVAKTPGLKRILLVVDHSQMMPMSAKFIPAKMRDNLNATSWSHAGDFNLETAKASFYRIFAGVYDLPKWKDLDRPQFITDLTLANDPKAFARLNKAVKKYQATVLGEPSQIGCGTIPFIDQLLIPSVRQAKAQGIRIDVVFPPYPYVSYYDWIDRRFQSDPFPKGPVFQKVVGFKKCVITALEAQGYGDVKVIAMDNDIVFGNGLHLFMDSLHISKPEAFEHMLRNVNSGQYELTTQNFDQYRAQLERNILSVKRPN